MCGLTLTIASSSTILSHGSDFEANSRLLSEQRHVDAARGPDAQGSYVRRVVTDSSETVVTLSCGVLALRGSRTAQPLLGKRGALAWNGQVFGGVGVAPDENDAYVLFSKLEEGQSIDAVLKHVQGPYAFVYYDFETETIHFGVDALSRRSLLLHLPDERDGRLVLTSSRSGEARLQGLDMQALDGGQRGVINIRDFGGVSEAQKNKAVCIFSSPSDRGEGSAAASPPTVDGTLPRNPSASEGERSSQDAEFQSFLAALKESVGRRVSTIPAPAKGDARVAVLFSGGVDCTLLTFLLHQWLPEDEPIDLLNVAFQQPHQSGAENISYEVPDRASGRDACRELSECCPKRAFRFVEINVPLSESQQSRQQILDLIYPSDTEMDLSLGYPLFFAARGEGVVRDGEDVPYPFRTAAKVLISGLGADEQLGGYTRHRRAYDRGSWTALSQEIQLDVDRIPLRNLSRDDRVISSQAREARYPYLDENLMELLAAMPVWAKCDMRLPPGQGDKILIRLSAQHCGLQRTAGRVKRAMQFGTKSAKLNPGKGHYKITTA